MRRGGPWLVRIKVTWHCADRLVHSIFLPFNLISLVVPAYYHFIYEIHKCKLLLIFLESEAVDPDHSMSPGDRAILFLEKFLWKNTTIDVKRARQPTKDLQTNMLKEKVVQELQVSLHAKRFGWKIASPRLFCCFFRGYEGTFIIMCYFLVFLFDSFVHVFILLLYSDGKASTGCHYIGAALQGWTSCLCGMAWNDGIARVECQISFGSCSLQAHAQL